MEEGDGLPIDVKLPILNLDCVIEHGKVILEHVDHVVKVSEGVILATISTQPDMKADLVTRSPV